MPADRLSPESVRKVARLGRLELSDTQVEKFAGQLTQVLGYIERLRELDLEGVQPLTNPADALNCLAPDEPSAAPGTVADSGQPSTRLSPDDLMKMAPATHPPFVRVPKVLGDDGGA